MKKEEALALLSARWDESGLGSSDSKELFMVSMAVGLTIWEALGYEITSFLIGPDADAQHKRDFGPGGTVPVALKEGRLGTLVREVGLVADGKVDYDAPKGGNN